MSRASAALARSPWFARSHGHDHMLVCNTFRVGAALRAFKGLLVNATLGWFEDPTALRAGPNTLYRLAFWRCTVVVPYQANPYCRQQQRLRHQSSAPETRRRRDWLFFQGSYDAAPRLRRNFRSLEGVAGAQVAEVSRSSLSAAHPWSSNRSRGDAANNAAARTMARFSKLGTARGMLHSDFCLVPKGDTPTSSRLYSAVACGCVPLVLSDQIRPHLPFARRVRFGEFVTFVRERLFGADPLGTVWNVTERLRPSLGALRTAMEVAAPDLLYDAPAPRVAENMLEEWRASCAPGAAGRRVESSAAPVAER